MSPSRVERPLLLPGGGKVNCFSVCLCPLVAKTEKDWNVVVTLILALFHYLLCKALTVSECPNEQH